MMIFPGGIGAATMLWRVKLQPIPKTTSAFARNSWTGSGITPAPVPHHGGNLSTQGNCFGRLGDGRVGLRGSEEVMNLRGGTRVTQGKQQEGHRVRIGGGDARKGIFRSRAGLHGEDADLMTVGDPAEDVRDSDSNSFLTADEREDACRGGCFDSRGGGF